MFSVLTFVQPRGTTVAAVVGAALEVTTVGATVEAVVVCTVAGVVVEAV